MKLQVSITCVLLKALLDQSPVQASCPRCPKGYFLITNCSEPGRGIQCSPCTDCSDLKMETLVPCSESADAECGPLDPVVRSAGTSPPASESPPHLGVALAAVSASLVLLVLLALAGLWRSFRRSPYSGCGHLTQKPLPPLKPASSQYLP
ncbi:uncharacterized protein ACNS7B_003359 [Menidia menidia]